MAAQQNTVLTDHGKPDETDAPISTKGAAYQGGSPLWLIAAERNRATEGFPLWLAPGAARIVAVGRHNFLPMTAVGWVSDRNEIVVAIEGKRAEIGRGVLIRIWTRDSSGICRSAIFQAQGGRAVASAVMGTWNGQPVAGLTLLSLIRPGEEL